MQNNPLNARTLDDLERMQRDYEAMLQQQNQLASIPYSNQRLTSTQQEISNEMSKYGSDLTPALIGCGAIGCLGITAYLVNKYGSKQPKITPKQQPKKLPIYIDLTGDGDVSDEYIYENITVKPEPK